MPEIVALPDDQLIDFSIESIQAQEELARKEQALTLVNTTFNEYR